jgi:diketogulonate reductase-like aldo/keto reductase
MLPIVGLGTWQTFDVGQSKSSRESLKQVLKIFAESGASVIDSSPMYGTSETVVGDLSTALNINSKLFVATKVWTSGKESGITQMTNSLKLLRREKVDLMQIHNLIDWKTHIETLKAWKDEGKIRYMGVTHYLDGAHDSVEQIIKRGGIDFIQINYSVISRGAEKRLLPLAMENKVAVLINRPFEEGELFQRVRGKTLPKWAKEFDCNSWGQFFLKYILSNPAVTCVIPGTSKVYHLLDNLQAGIGKMPGQEHRKMMIELL